MKTNPYQNPFIVIEGIDGCGKSTLIEGIKKWDKRYKVGSIFTKEPTDGEFGQKIRRILNNAGIDDESNKVSAEDLQKLYIYDRLAHRQNEAAFLEVYPIFSDRDFFSTLAYGNAGDFGFRKVLSNHETILGDWFFAPDLVLIIDLLAKETVKRINKSKRETDYFEKLEFLKRVRDGYLALPRLLKAIYPNVKSRIIMIDGAQAPEEVLKDSMVWIDKTFQEKWEATQYIKIFKKKGEQY